MLSILALLLACTPVQSKTWLESMGRTLDPLADPSAIVTTPTFRFTVLTPSVIRIEYHPAGVFDDLGTVNILNRRTPVPNFTLSRKNEEELTITTSALELTYKGMPAMGGEPGFLSAGLSVKLLVYPFTVWMPLSPSKGNLHGTIRTLDRVGEAVDLTCLVPRDAMTYYAHCEDGFASKDGWVLMDESLRPRLHPHADPPTEKGPRRHPKEDWPWVTGPPQENIANLQSGRRVLYYDWYFFGHGLDFPQALADYTLLSGPIPLLPRYALGPGFSRWYAWNEHEEISHIIQGGFASHGVPLDQLSIDMDWHPSYPRGLPNNLGVQVEGWTGYSVYPKLFPALGAFLAHTKRRGVFVNLNMHPASGVEFHEAAYPAAALAMSIHPASGQTIPFDFSNQSYAAAVFEHVLRPLDNAGLDYWWIDYQHGPFSSVPLLNPTFLTNFAWWTNPWRYGDKWSGLASVTAGLGPNPGPEDLPCFGPATVPNALLPGKRKHGDRPYIFGRWGGLGGHRYPVGFAGDTAVKWRVLRYETFFSPTSSNVGFMWTHDIGGFEGSPPPELLTRWVQWGCFSALLRTHSSKLSPGRSLWSYPNPYLSIMRSFYRLRARLMPYIATANRLSHDSGLQLLRPMYYTHPLADAAYADQGLHQYWWGPDVWVAPIAAPAAKDNCTSATGVALKAQTEAKLYAASKLRPGRKGVPYANRTLHQRNGLTAWTVWVPPGPWVEWWSWGVVEGAEEAGMGGAATGGYDKKAPPAFNTGPGSFITRNYSLGEMPVFSRPGTILPMRTLPDATSGSSAGTGGKKTRTPLDGAAAGDGTIGAPPPGGGSSLLGLAGQPYGDLTLWVLPLTPHTMTMKAGGGGAGTASHTTSTRLYEDDGLSKAAEESGVYGWSNISCVWGRKVGGSGGAGKAEGGGGILDSIGSALGVGGGSKNTVDTVACTLYPPVLGPGAGSYEEAGIPDARALTFRFIGSWLPTGVSLSQGGGEGGSSSSSTGGIPVPRDQAAVPDSAGDHGGWMAGENAWAYGGDTLSVWVRVGAPAPTAHPITVTLTLPPGFHADDALLTQGFSRSVARSLVCKDEVDRGYSLIYPSDVEDILNVSASATAFSAASSAAAIRHTLEALPREQRAGIDRLEVVASTFAGTPSGYVLHQRCAGALNDAVSDSYPPAQLGPRDPRAAQAAAPQKYGSTIEHPRGSMPGAVSQYSSTPGQDEYTALEGIEDYYTFHTMWGTTHAPPPGNGMPPEIAKRPIRTAAINEEGEKVDPGVFDEQGDASEEFEEL